MAARIAVRAPREQNVSNMSLLFNYRGASPLGLPDTLSREPLRRLAPFAWLASLRSLASSVAAPCLAVAPSIATVRSRVSREPLRRLAPFAWLASLRLLAHSSAPDPVPPESGGTQSFKSYSK